MKNSELKAQATVIVTDLSHLRQLPLSRIKEIVRNPTVSPYPVDWHGVATALIERIEDAKGYPRVLYDDEW